MKLLYNLIQMLYNFHLTVRKNVGYFKMSFLIILYKISKYWFYLYCFFE